MSSLRLNFNLGFLRSQRKMYSILLLFLCIVVSLTMSTMPIFQGIMPEGFVANKKSTSFISEILSDNSTDKGIRVAAIKSITTVMDKKDAKPYLEILEDSSMSDDIKIKKIQDLVDTNM